MAHSAKEIEKFFTEQKGRADNLYRDTRVWNGLYDPAATRDRIRGRLSEMAQQVKQEDVVFLFFSGHGTVPAGQEMFYFATTDIRGPNPQDVRETGLNTAMLAEAIREMPARRVMLVFDACQSGGAVESLAKVAEMKARAEGQRARAQRKGASDHEHEVGVYVIAAATTLQQAVQPKAGNSALVEVLLEALREGDMAADGKVWVRGVVSRIQRRLPEVSERLGRRQNPMDIANGLDFPIAGKEF